jgi:hypothetical protein
LQAEHLTAAQAVDERELHRQADAVVANSIEKLTALLHGECPAFLGADRGGATFHPAPDADELLAVIWSEYPVTLPSGQPMTSSKAC